MKSLTELIGFIPKPLAITDKPELSVFPEKLHFLSLEQGNDASDYYYSVYLPDLSTYRKAKGEQILTYYNVLNQDINEWRVDILYNKRKRLWTGNKYYKKRIMTSALGRDWENFFYHLGRMGVVS